MSWSQSDLAKHIVEKLTANPQIGDCRFHAVTLTKNYITMTVTNSDQLMDVRIPRNKITSSSQVFKANYVQTEFSGARDLPFALKSHLKIKFRLGKTGEIKSVKIRSVDYGLFPIVPVSIETYHCR